MVPAAPNTRSRKARLVISHIIDSLLLFACLGFVQSIDDMVVIHMMNLSAVDLNLLVALEALISEAHVGRAARKIGLSQSATSPALNRLRGLLTDSMQVPVGSRMAVKPRAMGLAASPD